MKTKKKNLVLDASIALKWFFEEKDTEKALQILKDIKEAKIIGVVPHLFYFEIANVLKTKTSYLLRETARSLKVLFNIPLQVVKTDLSLLSTAHKYARKFNLSIYDASYIAVAFLKNATLVTADEKMVKKVKLSFIKTL